MTMISPRRRLPWDVLLLVFKEADPSTLAVLGRVSHDFLTATAPELYRDVVVTSVKQLEWLFCERIEEKTKNSSKTSRINPHLSLSQIRTLTIIISSLSSIPDSLISISSSRLDDERPLPLELLEVNSDYSKVEVLRLLYPSLFPRLDPTRCSYKIVGRALPQVRWVDLNRNYATQLLGWTQIQTLDLSGVFPCVFLSGHGYLAGLPSPFPDHRRVLRLHVASLLSSSSTDSEAFMDSIGRKYVFFDLGGMQDGSIVLVVKSEEEKREAEAAVRTSQEIERWRHVFAVEMET